MDQLREPGADVLQALVARVEALERRCTLLELEVGAPRSRTGAQVAPPKGSGGRDAFDESLAMLKAMLGYSRGQRLEDLRADPEALAAIRAAHAKRNVFLTARGLPPVPETYPELP